VPTVKFRATCYNQNLSQNAEGRKGSSSLLSRITTGKTLSHIIRGAHEDELVEK